MTSERYTYMVHTPDKSEPKPEAEVNLSEPVNLDTKAQLIDFFSTYARLQKDPIKFLPDVETWAEEKAKEALAEIQARAEDSDKTKYFPQRYFFGVYDGDKMIGTGEVHILCQKNKTKYAYLGHMVVDPEYRTKQVSVQLGKAQAELAAQEGCEFLTALINTRNLPIIKQALNNGFYIGEVITYRKREPRWSEFKIFKKIDQSAQGEQLGVVPKTAQKLQVPLFDIEEIKNKLSEGYIGTRVIEVEPANVEIGKTVYEYGDVRKFVLELETVK